ncbi:hypothetical protein OSTOST_03250 [Ostertagia ostertagi]
MSSVFKLVDDYYIFNTLISTPIITAKLMDGREASTIGLPNVKRCVIHADEKRGDEYSIIVEGGDFRGVLSQPGIDGPFTNFNNALFVA